MGLVSEPRRLDVFLVNLDPTLGSEILKTRPAAVVSPDDMNRHLRTVVVAPMMTARRPWPTRVAVDFAGKQGDVALDQIRTIDKVRLGRCLGRLADAEAGQILDVLRRMFA